MLKKIRNLLYRYPITGIDFTFAYNCPNCNKCATMCSRGKLIHCYSCGHEFYMKFNPEDVSNLRLSSWSKWTNWKKLPYNWHTLSEEDKMKYLGKKRKIL